MKALLMLAFLAGCSDEPPEADAGEADLAMMAAVDLAQPAGGATRYPAGVLHSPYTRGVVDRLAAILVATPYRKDTFMKVGDSITVSTNFLDCFTGASVMLDADQALEPSRVYWQGWDRMSLTATGGWTTARPLEGMPSWLEKETTAIQPAFAVVMMGTNDTEPTGLHRFERNLRLLIDAILAEQVVPLLSTIPPRGDDPVANGLVPEMNAVVRAVAQARQVPYLDYWQTMVPLPSLGLGPDGIHPNVYVSSGAKGCYLTPAGLMFGFNQRNKITLTALDRAKRFLVDGTAPEAAPAPLPGTGTWSDPRVIDALPFVDDGDTSISSETSATMYSCGTQDESGPEIVYRIELSAPTKLRARVFADDGADIDVHWLDSADASKCSARADKTLDITAGPGTFWLSADTFVSGGKPLAGGFRLTLVQLP